MYYCLLVYSHDPALWSLDEHTIDYLCIHGFSQDLSTTNLLKSKRFYLITLKKKKIYLLDILIKVIYKEL
jgi:hypothetical protein